MVDYSCGKIYKLVCRDVLITDQYVGSTCAFSARRFHHKKNTTNRVSKAYHRRVYTFIRNHGGFENWDMIQIEAYPCNSKLELLARERYWYDQLKPTLNTNIPNRSSREFYSQPHQKEKKKILNEKYRNNHKLRLNTKINCDKCKGKYIQRNKYKHIKTKKHLKGENQKLNDRSNQLDQIEDDITNEFNRICSLIDNVLKNNN